MAEQGLVAKAHRKTRATTNSNHDYPVAPNLLGRQFDVQHRVCKFFCVNGFLIIGYNTITLACQEDKAMLESNPSA
jgi:transposase InsO family protein